MLVSYNWLKDFVDLDQVTPEQLADKITKAGIEVEHVYQMNEGIKNVVVGHVVSCERHPDADKLNLCQVDIGEETVQIVCGAPNVGAGQKVAVAKVGARLPGGLKIKRSKLRGEVSHGMICSLSELGVDQKLVPKEYADGIYVLDDKAEPGADALPYLNLDDAILDLDILPSSAHCLNMIGVAYEVAAILGQQVKLPQPDVKGNGKPAEAKVSVSITAKEAVPYYGAKVIEGVTIQPSPRWLQNRLIASGIRPINNIVDISNYVMLEYGQPLHAFDFNTFGSDKVVVRYAEENEKMTTLDETERTLVATDVLITNGQTPVAIAGVMGGANSEVTDSTKTILLESAVFDSLTVRMTSSRLQLRTDASQRYEKGIDRNRVAPAAERASELIRQIAGGSVYEGLVESGEREIAPVQISITQDKINGVLGTQLMADEILSIFRRLQFDAEADEAGAMLVRVPARRPDVTIPEDLIEEVGRIYGYDHVPATLPEGVSQQGGLTHYQSQMRKVKRYMEGAGLQEAVTYSLTTLEKAKMLTVNAEAGKPVHLAMPMSEERKTLRMSLVPSLLEVVQYHLNRQMQDIALFEIGKVFYPAEEDHELPNEEEHLSAVLTGHLSSASWSGKSSKVDFFTLKGLVEGLLGMIGESGKVQFKKSNRADLHPGRSADVYYDNQLIGYAGQLHPSAEKTYDLQESYIMELNVAYVLKENEETLRYEELPRYPAITRDIALVVDRDVPAGDLQELIVRHGGKLLKEAVLFDVYEGEHLDADKKSLAFSLKYLDPEKTLTDEEVLTVHQTILAAAEETFGAVLRG